MCTHLVLDDHLPGGVSLLLQMAALHSRMFHGLCSWGHANKKPAILHLVILAEKKMHLDCPCLTIMVLQTLGSHDAKC